MSRLWRLRFRLWERRVWWRWTWWFQFAHGPLCQRFRHDTVRLGRFRLCRSCTMLYAALALTLGIVFWVGAESNWLLPAGVGLGVPLVALSEPRLYRHFPRWLKDLLRAAAGVVLGLLLGLFATTLWWVAASASLLLLALHRVYRRLRQQVKARDCHGCPELGCSTVCSGYAEQAESIRRYSEVIEEELNRPMVASLLVLPDIDHQQP